MEMPQELEVWYVIPALRKALAGAMLRKGLKQKDIAVKLGLKKSAISQYVKSQRGTEMKFDKKIAKRIGDSACRIIKGESNSREELVLLCDFVRKDGCLCMFHKSLNKNLKGCEVCKK